jgi:hypothetical protein
MEMETVALTLIVGIGATATTDLWALVRKRLFGVPPPNWALVGRWFAHMRHGRFRHDSIAAAPAARAERLIGWTAHYLIGIAFAGLLLCIWGVDWIHRPTIVPAFIVGLGTVAAPFLLMQPGMGLGIAAGRTPRPWNARLHSLVTHAVFGLGLYAFAWAAKGLHCAWYAA